MNIIELKNAVSHIIADDEYKIKTVQILKECTAHTNTESGRVLPDLTGNHAYSKDNADRAAFRRHIWSPWPIALTAVLAVILLVGVFLVNNLPSLTSFGNPTHATTAGNAAFPTGTQTGIPSATTAGCDASIFDDMNYAFLEINGSAYYVKGDGKLFRYDLTGDSAELTALPIHSADSVCSDGTYLYYTEGKQIIQLSVGISSGDFSSRVIWGENRAIKLDYADQNRFIYHDESIQNLQYNYTVLDRTSGISHLLIETPVCNDNDRSTEVYLDLLDVSAETAIFGISGSNGSSLCAVNLSSLGKTKIYDNFVPCARIVGDTVYFTPDIPRYDTQENPPPQIWSVNINGGNLTQNDLSLSDLNSISWIVKSETDLLIATYYTVENGACVYLYQPESGEMTLLKDGLGNISSLFATEHYFSFYSQDPSTAGEDFTLTKQIPR